MFSRYRAALLGGPEHRGWGTDRYLAADTRDLLMLVAYGLAGEATTTSDLWPRPKTVEPEKEAAPVGTIAEFDTAAFLAGRW